MVACNQQLLHSPTYIHTYVHLYVRYIVSCACLYFCKLSARLYASLEISFIHLYVQQVLINGDESKQPKKSKQEVCLCVCEGGGGGAQHLTHCVVNSVCPCMAASVESGQFPIDCLCVPCTHTYTYVRTRNGKLSRFKIGWLLGL